MADRKAVNRYYPPDFDPTKHGSINKYHNSHPLRERAKRLSEGILVIRFEMPYNIWCGGCGNHIGMGVRYNAEKTKVGNYYTTPIYRFRMKCHLCDNYFEMETNPMECDYTIVTGAYRKNQKWDMAENEQVLTEDRQTVKKLASDPMFKLEHGVDDSKKLQAVAPTLHELEKTQTSWKDDFEQNRQLRKQFRMEKNKLKLEIARDTTLLAKSSLDIQLVPEHEDDRKLASLMKYNVVETYDEKQRKKRQEISNQSIFSSNSSSSSSSSSTCSGTPKSPQNDVSKEVKISEFQKRLGLIDKLKASKRSRIGFVDFGCISQKKIPCQSNGGKGIVVSKKEKERACEEGLKGCSENGERLQHRLANLNEDPKALRVVGFDDCSGKVYKGDHSSGEENDQRFQDWDKKRPSQDSNDMELSKGCIRNKTTSGQTEGSDCDVQASVDAKGLLQEPSVHPPVSLLASDNGNDGQQSKSLVSFDYSSSDSDN